MAMDDMSSADDSGYASSEFSRIHPDKLDHEHVETFQVFIDDLNQALKGSFPLKTHPYTAVYVLMLRWTEDDLNVQSEIDQLRNVFEQQFHFETEEWQIPSSNSTRSLQYKLFELQHAHQSESELLIVYYGGHGEADRRGRSIWRANQQAGSPSLTWSSLQHLLENAIPHILIVLDCCFAANAARDTTNGSTKEILAACGRENPTLGVGIRSFTSALIEELQAFGTVPFSVAMLHARLVTMRWRLAFTPIYALLSEHGGTSIQLSPLPIVDISVDDTPSLDIPRDHVPGAFIEDPENNFTDNTLDYSRRASTRATRVLLAVSIAINAPQVHTEWLTWLTSNTPSGIINLDARIESVYESHSTLVIVSVPIHAWNRLPDKNAYQFIGFIKSGNQLPRLELARRSARSWHLREKGSATDKIPRPRFPGKSPRLVRPIEVLDPRNPLAKRAPSPRAIDDDIFFRDQSMTVNSDDVDTESAVSYQLQQSFPSQPWYDFFADLGREGV